MPTPPTPPSPDSSPEAAHRGPRTRPPYGPIALGIVALAAIGVIIWGIRSGGPAQIEKAAAPEVNTSAIQLGTLVETTKISSTVSRVRM